VVNPRLILILGDQLSPDIAALKVADKSHDIVVMAEVMAEGTSTAHHPQKIAMILIAMRKFLIYLQRQGWKVAYSRLDDADNTQSITGEMQRYAQLFQAKGVVSTKCGEWRLQAELAGLDLPLQVLEDRRFICSEAEFSAWADGRRELRMEYFYREMRRKTGLLMQGDQPVMGRWNFDAENRKPAAPDLLRPRPPRFAPCAITREVLDLVAEKFNHFGDLDSFSWATDRAQALQVLDHFIANVLPRFGAEQDAMLRDDPTLSHALISPYLNIGLLSPLEVCRAAEAATAPIEAVEGFIRQIIGWREYMRGIYMRQGAQYLTKNDLGAVRDLPALYWGGPTKMACMGAAIQQTKEMAYAHHIQRLMVTGNFALLAGISPQAVHHWYLSVYIDAFEWVELPNTLGMSQFADGGIIASKPYVSSGAYINRMSDYCGGCAYKVGQKTGEEACPFNALYWDFLDRHRPRFARNARMGQMYRTWDKMAPEHRAKVLQDAAKILEKLDNGQLV
jgi:deoxyribodipyrimidine photolyase-related protein